MDVSIEEAIASKEFYEGYQYYEHYKLHGTYPDGGKLATDTKNPYVSNDNANSPRPREWDSLNHPAGRWCAGACSYLGSNWLGIFAGTKPTWSPPVENLQLSLFDEV